jgi:Ca-activated chloride channel family protein
MASSLHGGWVVAALAGLAGAVAGLEPGEIREASISLLEPTYNQVAVSLTPAVLELNDPLNRCEWIDILVDGLLADSLPARQPSSGRYETEIDLPASAQTHTIAIQAYDAAGNLIASDETRTARLPPGGLTTFVNLVPLYVTVTEQGTPVTGLTAADFRIREAGAAQPIAHFESNARSTSIAVLLDHSYSVQGEPLKLCRQAAASLIKSLREGERAAFLTFSNRVSGVPSFTAGRQILLEAIGSAAGGGGTALNDAIYTGLELLDSQPSKKALILFSDGLDAHSVLSADYVRWRVRASDALIYLVLFDHQQFTPYTNNWRGGAANQKQYHELKALIEESGGRLFQLQDLHQLEPVFQTILGELRSQYYLAYYDQDARRDGSWRQLDVEVRLSGVNLRTRAGFWDR